MGSLNELLDRLIDVSLAEDGVEHDETCEALLDAGLLAERVTGRIVAKDDGIIAGMFTVEPAYLRQAPPPFVDAFALAPKVDDDDRVEPGQTVLEVSGHPMHLLTRERVVLNFLGHLSGVATATRALVDACAGTSCRILHTRKTTPALRHLELEAVQAGGGEIHRRGLDDGIMLKENHFIACGGADFEQVIAAALARRTTEHEVVVETESVEQAIHGAEAGADVVMIDDFWGADLEGTIQAIRRAKRPRGAVPVQIEVSGGVTLENAARIAEAGADRISVGAITHSAPQLDLSFRLD